MNRQPSYVLGNSRQILRLTNEERSHLDRAEWVFACNSFPSQWRTAGFRPTVWAFGDNHDASCIPILQVELDAIRNDPEFLERCRHMLVCKESHGLAAAKIVEESKLPITFYRRGHWGDATQTVAEIGQPIYHWGTTITDLINFAWIFNPGQEIRMAGFQVTFRPDEGHFYDPPDSPPASCLIWPPVVRLFELGLPLVDCHLNHGRTQPPGMEKIPRKGLLET